MSSLCFSFLLRAWTLLFDEPIRLTHQFCCIAQRCQLAIAQAAQQLTKSGQIEGTDLFVVSCLICHIFHPAETICFGRRIVSKHVAAV